MSTVVNKTELTSNYRYLLTTKMVGWPLLGLGWLLLTRILPLPCSLATQPPTQVSFFQISNFPSFKATLSIVQQGPGLE